MRAAQTIAELEQAIGEQVRTVRIARNLDQVGLARLADISVRAVRNLELGKGSSMSTLLAVVRALDRTDWIEGLAPTTSVSPMRLLRARGKPQASRRVRTSQARP